MPRPTIIITLVIASLGWLLAACGQAAVAPPTSTPAQPAPTTTQPTRAPGGSYADIPQGVTPEGYQYLGDPAAPVTLVMYSDFF
jgi:hypothetical protein